MKILQFLVWFAFLSLAAPTGAAAKDVVFESSDGAWTDGTYESKGSGFKETLVSFELYKMKTRKSDVTLVRITSEPKIGLLWSKKDRLNPKWKAPLQPSSGRATHNLSPYRFKNGEMEEVRRRAEAAYAFWKNN
jgi:hypothetical protein